MTAQIGIYHLDAMALHRVLSSTIDWGPRDQMDNSLPLRAIKMREIRCLSPHSSDQISLPSSQSIWLTVPVRANALGSADTYVLINNVHRPPRTKFFVRDCVCDGRYGV